MPVVGKDLPNGTAGAQDQYIETAARGYKILAFCYTLVTTNPSAGRLAFLDVEKDGDIIFRVNLQAQVDASTATYRYSQQVAIAGMNQVQLDAPIPVGQGQELNLEIASVAAGDQMSDIHLVIEYD